MMPDWVRSHLYEAQKRLARAQRAMAALAVHPAMPSEVLRTADWLALSDGIAQAYRMCATVEAAYADELDGEDDGEVW